MESLEFVDIQSLKYVFAVYVCSFFYYCDPSMSHSSRKMNIYIDTVLLYLMMHFRKGCCLNPEGVCRACGPSALLDDAGMNLL